MSCALPVVCPRPLRNNEPAVGGVRLLRAFRPSSGAVADNQPYAGCQQGRVENVLPSARRADGNDVLGPLLADRRSGAMLRCQCDRPVLLPLALFVSADRRHAFHGGLRAAAVEAVACWEPMISAVCSNHTGEATLPLRWLCQLPLCRLAAEKRLQAIIPRQQVYIPPPDRC